MVACRRTVEGRKLGDGKGRRTVAGEGRQHVGQ